MTSRCPASLPLFAVVFALACSSAAEGPGSSAGGSSGSGGHATGSGGAPGSGGSGGADTGGAGGAATGSGGAVASGGAGGESAAGTTGTGGTTVDGGTSSADVATAEVGAPAGRAWTCPMGPFEAPKAGPSKAVCGGLALNYGWNEGPTWVASQKAFFFSNFTINGGNGGVGDMVKYTPATGQCEIFIEGNGCNGLGAAPDGSIIAACQKPRAILKYDPVTKQSTVLAEMLDGKMLDAPNDLVVHHNGTVYFTNPPNDLGGRPVGFGPALMRLDPAGKLSVIAKGKVNGIAISPDEKRLYLIYMGSWELDDEGVPVKQGGGFTPGGDGLTVDCAGNVYDQSGTIHDPSGGTVGKFPGGTNMAFGGPDAKTILVVAGKGAHTVEMNLPGLPY
jgi:sugar lactone lactonase YvrE